jgi:hypothetical protein
MITKFSKSGELLGEFNWNLFDAKSKSGIYQSIKNQGSALGFVWSFDGIYIQPKEKNKRKPTQCKKVIQSDTSGNLIKIWDSIGQASKSLNISTKSIFDCRRGVQKSAGGFIWTDI